MFFLKMSKVFKSNKEKADFDAHIVAWVCALIPGRLLVGPFPKSEFDLVHLGKTHCVRYLVSIKEDDANDKDKVDWYRCFHNSSFFDNEHQKPTYVHEPLPHGFSKLNQAQQIKHYLAMADRLVIATNSGDGCIYIHNETGFEEEAFLAFVLWAKLDKATLPKNVGEWLVAHNFDQLLQEKEESRKMIQVALKEATAVTRTIGSMFEAMTKKQKTLSL